MAKKGSIQKNLNRVKKVKSLKNKRDKLKNDIYNKSLDLEQRFDLVMKLAKLPRNSARNRIRNRCELTGRPRGYYRKFNMSRIMLRKLGSEALIPGLIKSSW